METSFVILNIIVLLIFIAILYKVKQKSVSFSKRVFTGLGFGIEFISILAAFTKVTFGKNFGKMAASILGILDFLPSNPFLDFTGAHHNKKRSLHHMVQPFFLLKHMFSSLFL